jgi:phosphopantetheinyl transferase
MLTVRLTLARFSEDDRAAWLASAVAVLSEDERERIAATPDLDARARHAIGRATIRMIGADASGRRPSRLAIAVSDAGKPRLADLPELETSIAHTGRVVVVAACRSAAVGVDIEPALATAPDPRRLAERLFAEAEVVSLRDLPDAGLADWLSSVWTIKEAVGKALGLGMVPAFAGAIVEQHGSGFALISVPGGPPADSWTLHRLTAPGGDEKIAVALPAPGVELEPVSQLTLEAFTAACSAEQS